MFLPNYQCTLPVLFHSLCIVSNGLVGGWHVFKYNFIFKSVNMELLWKRESWVQQRCWISAWRWACTMLLLSRCICQSCRFELFPRLKAKLVDLNGNILLLYFVKRSVIHKKESKKSGSSLGQFARTHCAWVKTIKEHQTLIFTVGLYRHGWSTAERDGQVHKGSLATSISCLQAVLMSHSHQLKRSTVEFLNHWALKEKKRPIFKNALNSYIYCITW